MSDASILREAAALMRERALAATPERWMTDGPWWVDPPGEPISETTVECRTGVTTYPGRHLIVAGGWETRDEDMQHIASWHPAVALAVADWLDHEADMADGWEYIHPSALAVARAYLRSDA